MYFDFYQTFAKLSLTAFWIEWFNVILSGHFCFLILHVQRLAVEGFLWLECLWSHHFLAVQNSSLRNPCWDNLQEPWAKLQEPWDNLQEPGTFTFWQTNTFKERPQILFIFHNFNFFDNFLQSWQVVRFVDNIWQFYSFWQFLTMLSTSDNLDNSCQFWHFWLLLTTLANFGQFKQFLIILANFDNSWKISQCSHFFFQFW